MKSCIKNSIRVKFTLGLSIIFILSGIILNISIRQIFKSNLENTIKNSMNDMMKSSREYIRYNMVLKGSISSEDFFYDKVWNLLDNSTITYNCELEIRDNKGKVIGTNITVPFSDELDKGTRAALDGKAVINLKYEKNNMYAILSYPVYYEDKCLGILNISKSYEELYSNDKNIINIITFIEIIVFVFVFIFSYLLISKITKPIIVLTKEIKRIEDGDYEVRLDIKSSDEIGILMKEFINMKDKIKNQINTITKEKEKVLKLEKGRREFFNNVTHELKTPLTAISGYAQILLDETVEDRAFKNRAVERIYLESERLHRLVLDLISVSKGATFLEEDKKSIDMYKLLSEICSDMKIKGEKYSVSISNTIEKGYICGQENKIRQLIINVLDNAIKYSFSNEKVLVKAFNEDKFYKIEVINKAELIKDEIYSCIFEPFVKGRNVDEVGSSGLGLYICNEIIKEHNGEIYIENGEVIKVILKIPSLMETTWKQLI